jgi:predicted lipid-binding transport protein (Tim44 family)
VRVLRIVATVLGWLLTPIVAWAASFFGAWLGALLAGALPGATLGLLVTMVFAAAAALAATALWIGYLRRSPRARRALAVTEEGAPLSVSAPAGKEVS